MFIALVPAFNEEKTIGSVVRNLFQHVDRVVVIDDGSSDATARLAEQAGAVVISHSLNRGQGAALETGHEYARRVSADYVLHFDADGQFQVEDIAPALLKLQQSRAHILLGSRFLDKKSNMPWQKRLFIHPLARFFHAQLLGLKVSDVHNGFRILTKEALQKIRLQQDRMAHATEVLHLVRKENLRYVEFPVQVVYHEYGQTSLGGMAILKDLIVGSFLR